MRSTMELGKRTSRSTQSPSSGSRSRANAARALGILRGQAAIPDLLEALNSKDGRLLYENDVRFVSQA